MSSLRKRFGMDIRKSLMDECDLGIINGHITLNGAYHDAAAVRGLFAPPLFSNTFRLDIRFNGRRLPAQRCFWQPTEVERSGNFDSFRYSSTLALIAGQRGALLEFRIRNTAAERRELSVQYEVFGGNARQNHWEFGRPTGAKWLPVRREQGRIVIDHETDRIAVRSSLMLHPAAPGIFNADVHSLAPGEELIFHTAIALDERDRANRITDSALDDPYRTLAASRKDWTDRVRHLEQCLPEFSTDCAPLQRLYDRSVLHLLLNEWNVPEWKLHPYYATGGVNGGCCCNYLWNYGEPYRLWSLLNPESARENIKVFLGLDLTKCFAFFPDDGSAFGPYYPINQEKILLLTHAYVLQTGDRGFLHEKFQGRRIIDHMIEQALMHDDLSQPAVLVNYGDGNHHLELRGKLRYDGTVPDLNLRRCVNYHLADQLCRLAGVQPPCSFIARAEALKKLIEQELFDDSAQWFRALDMEGKPYLRYTIQMFKALGWNDWALTERTKKALYSQLNEQKFLGRFGMHSLSIDDPAYDPADIDNGGPGACISFTPAVVDRLFRDGQKELAWNIFRRLFWLADALPYWGDSHTADRMEYRRDTPLQNDIQGSALAQTVIFSLFGIETGEDFSISVSPYLPPEVPELHLKNLRLAGKTLSADVSRTGFRVNCDGFRAQEVLGKTIIIH